MAKGFVDRFFLVRLARDESKVRIALLGIVLLLLLLTANSVYLTLQSIQKSTSQPISPAPTSSPSIPVSLPPTVVPTSITSQINSSAQVTNAGVVKEYFIPFGSGSSQASDWTDVPGLTASVDFGSYNRIKEVHFEASVAIPTANESASVRLFNKTDMHPVWYSEITLMDGQYVSSNPISYDTGQKLYQVQMKTSLQYTANLIQSRLHVLLQ